MEREGCTSPVSLVTSLTVDVLWSSEAIHCARYITIQSSVLNSQIVPFAHLWLGVVSAELHSLVITLQSLLTN